MKHDNLYRSTQSLYQMKPGSDFGDSNPLVTVKQNSYAFTKKGASEKKRAVGGSLGSVNDMAAGDPARALRNQSNTPPAATLKRGGPMRARKEHNRRKI